MFLEQNNYSRTALLNKIVLITGGGGGIGYEASRAFSYMGAKVIIADIDAEKGRNAQVRINEEYGTNNVDFFEIDISQEKQIEELHNYIMDQYARLDVIINNAAAVPMGAIEKVSISNWDLSYAVNLRGPVLLLQKFLPFMKNTGGTIVFIPSAAVTPYMAAYEIFKSAQVELCNTLFEELSGTDVITYLIAPGFVITETAHRSVEIVASSLDITPESFYKSLEDVILDVELAGAGYAVSVVNEKKYNGQMTSSYQVLADEGLIIDNTTKKDNTPRKDNRSIQMDDVRLTALVTSIVTIFLDQYQGWQQKKLFQKQFILADFKKQMGISADHFKSQLETLQNQIQNHQWDSFLNSKDIFVKLQCFYEHQKELLKSYEKDATQLNNDTKLLDHWIDILQEIIDTWQNN